MQTGLLIGGERVAGEGAEMAVENPFDESTVASVAAASDEQLGAAIAADDRVDCVAFTGSVETGQKVAHRCALANSTPFGLGGGAGDGRGA